MTTMTTVWYVTWSYTRSAPMYLFAKDAEALCKVIRKIAGKMNTRAAKPIVKFEVYTDEVHAYLIRGRRRRAFMYVQADGVIPQDQIACYSDEELDRRAQRSPAL
jgi:hypothetical protein